MPDYENDLAFKPAMSWDELCEYAKSKCASICDGYFEHKYLSFYQDGDVIFTDLDGYYYTIASKRSYEQMKNIIDNLWSE